MTTTIRGADALLRALCSAGVDTIFTVSGNHIMPVFDAALDHGITLVHARHEAATVHMADAYARLTGKCGVALVTGGQGHTNAAAALPTALAGEMPVLLLSGHAPLGEVGLGAFQELDNAAIAAPLTKHSAVASSAAALPAELAAAMRAARAGRPGPVHLSLPTDVLDARIDTDDVAWPDADAFAPAAMALAPETAATIRAAIAAAARPLVLAPPSLCTPSGRALLARLGSALGVPVLPMQSPRGLNDPSLGAAAEMFARADLVVLLGKAMDFTLRYGRKPGFAPDARWIAVDPDAEMLARAARAQGPRLIVAALAAPAEAAAALAIGAPAAAHSGWAREVAAAIAWRPPAWDTLRQGSQPIHPVTLYAALAPHLDADTVLVSDGGEIGQWAQSLLADAAPIVNGVAGAIGSAIPFAIGARAAQPKSRVVAIMGDGTFGFHMAEFDTALRHNLPFVAVVGNDSRWNAEHQIQLREYGAQRAHSCELAPATRYDRVVEALGGHGEFVTDAADLPAAFARAIASGKPACVNVMIDGQPAPTLRRPG
ncbi:MAG: thiamine pyrophosphate-binding protein [Acetobacteraceae bacterium]|nr:thiamine pyrophosphate-binding protein [Acetobacteraceae bacterium]